ncbi:ABC transporter permease [Zavarzinia sp. CC-PAN008]|uniref:ABC transporter permease n=1 Tax=Zavarzinia sp. CC-PAN008 TaxID=3243332 RepID=UPI003F744AF6
MSELFAALGHGLIAILGFIGLDQDLLTRHGPSLLDGIWITIKLVAVATILGGILAIPVALARISSIRVFNWPATAFVFYFRGTPALIQLFLIYYGAGEFRQELDAIGLWWIFRDAWWCALIAFTLNTAAYQAEILRGGIQGVPTGELEAANALGFPRGLIFRRITLPTAYRIALPALGNEVILMVKTSAIVALVTIYDLMGATRLAFSRSFNLEIYLVAAVMYLMLTLAFTWAWGRLENRLNPQRRRPATAPARA